MSRENTAKQVSECRFSSVFRKVAMQRLNACSDFTDYFLSAGVCCANTMEL